MKPSQSKSYNFICSILFLTVGLWQLKENNSFAFLFFFGAIFFMVRAIRLPKK